VIPPSFEYVAPSSLSDAIQALSDGGEDAKLLAGGHSLLPLMKLRLAAPSLLVDLRLVPGLSGAERADGGWRIGAMTPHAVLEHTSELGLVAKAAGTIADPQVRNRGTIGGSLAHGDPASDLPAVMMVCEASLSVQGPSGERTISAQEMFQDYMETSLEPTEVVTAVSIPSMDGWGFGYEKFNRRSEDWAMVAVSAMVRKSGDTCEDVRIGLTNMGSTPLRASAAEEALRGASLSSESIAQAAARAAEGTDPPSDLNASAEYKRHLAQVLCRRALTQAAGLA
jgi:aerobic carbon-monoxide dehydrogenase medium subunit